MRSKVGTKAEEKRKDAMRELGCICCLLDGKPEGQRFEGCVEIHHMLRSNKKIGEHATVPLCAEHHTGRWSWHQARRWFRVTYGSDQELIDTVDNLLKPPL